MNSLVIIETNPAGNIGIITIDNTKKLNVLSLEIIQEIRTTLYKWQDDDNIAAVILKSSSDKAFCAGGDIKQILNLAKKPQANRDNTSYFGHEYSLDYLIHTYTKPVVVFGNGIVMGGGIGLMSGASHRIVTEKTVMAMPEITIGLFPDIGAGYFLHKCPGKIGYFLGLTGARINGEDAIYANLADYYAQEDQLQSIIEKINALPLGKGKDNNLLISELLKSISITPPTSALAASQTEIDEIICTESPQKTYEALSSYNSGNKLISKGADIALAGSPLSFMVIFEQLKRSKNLSLIDDFRMEFHLAVNMTRHNDFDEGVSSLIIRKDNSPQWLYRDIADIPADAVTDLFNNTDSTLDNYIPDNGLNKDNSC